MYRNSFITITLFITYVSNLDIYKVYKHMINFWYWFHCQLGHYPWCYRRSYVQCVEEVILSVSSRAKRCQRWLHKAGDDCGILSLLLLLFLLCHLIPQPVQQQPSTLDCFNMRTPRWRIPPCCSTRCQLLTCLLSNCPSLCTGETTSRIPYLSLNCQWDELSCFSRATW